MMTTTTMMMKSASVTITMMIASLNFVYCKSLGFSNRSSFFISIWPDGYAWPPGQKKSQTQTYIFDSEWCRSIALQVGKGSEFVGRLRTAKYAFKWGAFHYSKDGKGFCKPTPKKKENCLPNGVLNATACKGVHTCNYLIYNYKHEENTLKFLQLHNFYIRDILCERFVFNIKFRRLISTTRSSGEALICNGRGGKGFHTLL